MKNLIPLHDNLILRPAGKQEMLGLLHVPQAHQKNLAKGTVLEKAPACSPQIEIGDEVTYAMHQETRIEVDGTPFIVVSESQCIALVREIKPDPYAQRSDLKLVEGRDTNPFAK